MRCAFNKIMHGAILLSAMAVVGSAAAADGTITFTGKVTSATCNVSSEGGGANFTVALPPAAAKSLSSSGQVWGRTAFKIKVAGCTAGQTAVSTYFEQGSNTNAANRLVNTGSARNVDIQLLDSDSTPLAVGSSGKSVNLSGGNADLTYHAQYYATAAASAGDVRSTVAYTIVYP